MKKASTQWLDRVIERAGVDEGLALQHFGSKEELGARVFHRAPRIAQTTAVEVFAKHHTPRDRILGIFRPARRSVSAPYFRGCAFINASAEGPRTGKHEPCVDSPGLDEKSLQGLGREADAADPGQLGDQLMLCTMEHMITASMDSTWAPPRLARWRSACWMHTPGWPRPTYRKNAHLNRCSNSTRGLPDRNTRVTKRGG